MPDEELEAFKSRIDLREYAATLGYQLDRKESSRASSVMRDGSGDKVIIKRDTDSHFIYFSVRDDRDNGSVIDFAANRKRLSLGHVRKELRPWIGRPAAALPLFTPLQPAPKDRAAVEREYARMPLAARHAYLEYERRIPGSLLGSPRFVGRVRLDAHRNAVFPHFDLSGLCGFEKKNRDFTGFATGGAKGLWESHDLPDDDCLVLTESAIDALSHAALFPDTHARYRSIGGQVNDQQPALIRAAVLDLPQGSEVIAATDNDDAGRKLAAMIGYAAGSAGRPDLTFRAHHPASEGSDWNDTLRQSRPNIPFPTVRL
jgi:hypothetical protein